MTLAPGSFPWLLAHDLRLNWRRFAGMLDRGQTHGSDLVRVGAGPLIALVLGAVVLLHVLAWPVVVWLQPHLHGTDAIAIVLVAAVACAFAWMIAQSLFGASRSLYTRGDLDLLLGSPLPARRIIAAKSVAIAAGTCGSLALLTLPVANVGALVDRPAWLAIYPVLIALALIATALALALAMAMFALVGPRRARVVTQLLGAGIGGAFVLAAQIAAMLPAPWRAALAGWLDGVAAADRGIGAALRLPVDALRGDLAALAMLLGLAATLFAVATMAFGGRFASAALAAAGQHAAAAPAAAGTARHRFRRGLAANLRRKEWLTLARDPNLFAQLSLQIVYTIPLAVVLLRSETLPAALAIAPTIVVVAAQVAASLAWLTVSGEDAPELLATAPVSRAAVDRAKLSAVALPVALLLSLPLAGLALVSWSAALTTALFAAAAGASTGLLNLWHPMPGNRRGMLRRHSQSKLIGLAEHLLAVLWAVAIVLALVVSWATVVPVALVGCILAVASSWHPLLLVRLACRTTRLRLRPT